MKYKCKKNLVVKVGIKKRKVIWAIKDSTWELDEDSNIFDDIVRELVYISDSFCV